MPEVKTLPELLELDKFEADVDWWTLYLWTKRN